jgi:hypothetical protein
VPFDARGVLAVTHTRSPLIIVIGLIALAMFMWGPYPAVTRRATMDLASDEYRRLAEGYRRLADVATTAQERTELKLNDLGVRIDYLREQMESLQRLLNEVE